MGKLCGLKPVRVFEYFEEISAIPRGSGYMEQISAYCMNFAKKHNLIAVCDDAKNVIIYKDGSCGYEKSKPVILQGHLDMVWQKNEESLIDFEKDGLDIYTDGDFIKARGTTLGADNGIAVAMILAILESCDIAHPPIEAVFTTDEEVGMAGALKLDMSKLSGRKMINLDAEETKNVTVSCAGGAEFIMKVPLGKEKLAGTLLEIEVAGLLGGHSGIEIASGRVNSNILMARVLNSLKIVDNFSIISVDGGSKSNAIPFLTKTQILCNNSDNMISALEEIFKVIKEEIKDREPNFEYSIKNLGNGTFNVIKTPDTEKIIYMLLLAPNGVLEMSATIPNLVETSLNFGILKTDNDIIKLVFAPRSNKESALDAVLEKLTTYSKIVPCKTEKTGRYPAWEFNQNSVLQGLYKEKHKEVFGFTPEIAAIHAGLECGVFSDALKGLDAISFGPDTFDVHTINERLSISSTEKTFELVLKILEELK